MQTRGKSQFLVDEVQELLVNKALKAIDKIPQEIVNKVLQGDGFSFEELVTTALAGKELLEIFEEINRIEGKKAGAHE